MLDHSIEGGETEYLAPSQLVRQHLHIADTNRQACHTTRQGATGAGYQEIAENFGPSQELLVVDRQRLLDACAQQPLQPFWLVGRFKGHRLRFRTSMPTVLRRAFGISSCGGRRSALSYTASATLPQLHYRNRFKGQGEGSVAADA